MNDLGIVPVRFQQWFRNSTSTATTPGQRLRNSTRSNSIVSQTWPFGEFSSPEVVHWYIVCLLVRPLSCIIRLSVACWAAQSWTYHSVLLNNRKLWIYVECWRDPWILTIFDALQARVVCYPLVVVCLLIPRVGDCWVWLERYSLQRCVMGWGGKLLRGHEENLRWGFWGKKERFVDVFQRKSRFEHIILKLVRISRFLTLFSEWIFN